ncbi:MAG: HAD hydrolase-like protein [Bacteroidetes bacterium]|nr:HAD hydrolase-like protein [Bacteroidota bacterium]
MSIKLVVFDIAGTTIQDEIGVMEAFRLTLKKHGYDVPINEVAAVMGYKKIEAIKILLENNEPDKSGITPERIDTIHTDFVNHMISFYRNSPAIEAFPHAEDTFAKLHEHGIKVGLNTGFTRAIADTIINRLQWREKGLIDYLIASDEVEDGRPHPYMIRRMMEEFRISDPSEVAKVGDTEVDVREGQNAGCKYVIGITTGSFTREELEPYHPTHIIDDIAEVIAIVTE